MLRVVIIVFFFLSVAGVCHAQKALVAQPEANAGIPNQEPDLADVIPWASGLPVHLARLESDLQILSDLSQVKNGIQVHRSFANDASIRLEDIKGASGGNRADLNKLYQDIQEEIEIAIGLSNPLARRINLLSGRKTEWQVEKKRWQDWSASLHTDQDLPHLTTTFVRANEIVESALNSINRKLDAALEVQIAAGEVVARLHTLEIEIKTLISVDKRESLLSLSPPMFSPDYFAQFGNHLWQSTVANMGALSWPSRNFFVRYSWALTAQFLLFISLILFFRKNKSSLRDSERWNFLAARPLSSSLFVVILTTLLFAEYQNLPLTVKLLSAVLGGISFARIIASLNEETLKSRAALSVIILYVVFIVVRNIGIPDPLYRLFILVASLIVLYYFSCWIRESREQEDRPLFAWLLRLACLVLGVIVFAQLWGKVGLATFLFESSLTSLVIILAYTFFIYMTRGGWRWIFSSPPVWSFKLLRSEAELVSRRSGYLAEVIIVLFVLIPMILTTWGIYSSIQEARTGFFNLGFGAGALHINLGLIFISAGTLYGSFLLSWILPKVILDDRVAGSGLERGTRLSVSRLIQYFIVFVGFLLTVSVLGFDLTKLTIILSALGVGIGFGLQGIVNNFFSGLVLLFEQPVRVGDVIEVDGKWAEIRRIGLRSTTVQTFEKADVIIANANLISRDVINWTLGNRQVRLLIPVGVAYDSDIAVVKEVLLECAKEKEFIMKSPPPQVHLMGFGDNSLDFELRVWLTDTNYRVSVRSDLNEEIKRRFNEANIEIPFPQRDLHVRSIDSSTVVPSVQTGKKE